MNGYLAFIRRPADGNDWQVMFPDLPGCRSRGRTFAEASGEARRGLAAHLATLRMAGRPVPPPSSPAEVLLAVNEDALLARQVVGAILKAIEPDPEAAATLRLAIANNGRAIGFYGEERPRRRA